MGVVGNRKGRKGDFEKRWASGESERKNSWSWVGLATHDFHVWSISWEKNTVRLGSVELNTDECYEA